MLKLNQVMIGAENSKELVGFYKKFLGEPSMEDEGWAGWKLGEAFLAIGEHSEVKGKNKTPGRIMFVFETENMEKDFEMIKSVGGGVVKEPYQMENMWIATFEDPEGNYFQLMTPWE